MNAISVMKKDHRRVEELFKEIENTSDRALMKREKLFANMKMELDAHAHMEEAKSNFLEENFSPAH